jgi:hypothetical protein
MVWSDGREQQTAADCEEFGYVSEVTPPTHPERAGVRAPSMWVSAEKRGEGAAGPVVTR